MASKEELYVSLTPDAYKQNKSSVLTSQADLLQTLKRLHNLTVLARQKHDLKKRLSKLITSTLAEIDTLQDKLPTTKLPKALSKEEPTKNSIDTTPTKRNEIENELVQIQEKLRQLNN